MTFTLTIKTDNAAFNPDMADEIARLLIDTADKLNAGHDLPMSLLDIDGNRVGSAMIGTMKRQAGKPKESPTKSFLHALVMSGAARGPLADYKICTDHDTSTVTVQVTNNGKRETYAAWEDGESFCSLDAARAWSTLDAFKGEGCRGGGGNMIHLTTTGPVAGLTLCGAPRNPEHGGNCHAAYAPVILSRCKTAEEREIATEFRAKVCPDCLTIWEETDT